MENAKSRGIQPKQVLMSGDAKDLHDTFTIAAKLTMSNLQDRFPRLSWTRGLKGSEIARMSGLKNQEIPLVGVYPDGGIFLYRKQGRNVPLLAAEAKNQGLQGNAIERWFKNKEAMECLDAHLAYLTFCTGLGALPGGIMEKTLNHALLAHMRKNREHEIRSWNRFYLSGPSFFRTQNSISADRLSCLLSGFLIRKVSMLDRG